MKLLPGSPHPLGATWDGEGVNFALYSENATGVELCLFDEDGQETRLHAPAQDRLRLARLRARISGRASATATASTARTSRSAGLRFNPNVVLLDPYARGARRRRALGRGLLRLRARQSRGRPASRRRSRSWVCRAASSSIPSFDWEGDEPPRTPLHRSVIYEAHVRGLTMLHPEVPEALRGTYAGIAHPAIIELPARARRHRHRADADPRLRRRQDLLDKGLRNYWGYNSIGFFAPDVRYRSGQRARRRGARVQDAWSRRCTAPASR